MVSNPYNLASPFACCLTVKPRGKSSAQNTVRMSRGPFLHDEAERDLVICWFHSCHSTGTVPEPGAAFPTQSGKSTLNQGRTPRLRPHTQVAGVATMPVSKKAETAYDLDDRENITSPLERSWAGEHQMHCVGPSRSQPNGPMTKNLPPGDLLFPPWFCSHHYSTYVGKRHVWDGKIL